MLRVGTDCSGIEAPIQALRVLGVPHHHRFASDIDRHCVQTIKLNYAPEVLYGDPEGAHPDGDVTHRPSESVPDIDLYVAGFPCQPFSSAGFRRGFADGRGTVFFSCLSVIRAKRPSYFVLENVRGLLTHDKADKRDRFGRTWSVVWQSLLSLRDMGYVVKWALLNTRDYGIPHNRPRVFMVGSRVGGFAWPAPEPMRPLRDFVDWGNRAARAPPPSKVDCIRRTVEAHGEQAMFANLAFAHSRSVGPRDYVGSMCTNVGRSLWLIPLSRMVSVKECLALQGFPSDFRYESASQVTKQLGNSMSVNVLAAIFRELGLHAGWRRASA